MLLREQGKTGDWYVLGGHENQVQKMPKGTTRGPLNDIIKLKQIVKVQKYRMHSGLYAQKRLYLIKAGGKVT